MGPIRTFPVIQKLQVPSEIYLNIPITPTPRQTLGQRAIAHLSPYLVFISCTLYIQWSESSNHRGISMQPIYQSKAIQVASFLSIIIN